MKYCNPIDTVQHKLGGVGNSSVCCSDGVCQKTFDTYKTYQKELTIYQLGLPYIPKLLHADNETMTLYIERCGTPLGTLTNSGLFLGWRIVMTDVPELWQRRRHCSMIRSLAKRFHEDTGMHHNDIRFKNILVDDTGSLYLIDFEFAHRNFRDMNDDFILLDSVNPLVIVGVLLAVLAVIACTRKKTAA